jgi:tRNA dimethylallyltransferase
MNNQPKPKIIVIAGPTASGKTSIGIELAMRFNGEVVSADSMQVYRKMDIGTAKPGIMEQKGIRHHMLDVADPDQEFNAAIYASMASSIIRDIHRRKKNCIIVGGTGLYIKSLVYGLMPCPPADHKLRELLRSQCLKHGSEKLYRELERTDHKYAAKIHPNDTLRIIRAIEIIRLTGLAPSVLAAKQNQKKARYNLLGLFLHTDRQNLYRNIDTRADYMIEAGLLKETEELLEQGYSPDLKPLKSLGYRHMVNYLRGVWSLDEAIQNLKRDTRRYAKRQITWFRADQKMIWTDPNDIDKAAEKIKAFLADS